jgi:MFS family permease
MRFIEILFIAVAANALGLLILFIGGLSGVQYLPLVFIIIVGIFLVGVGYMCLYQCLMVWIKNLYPSNMRSQFEGIRMIFYVCIPMFLGTFVGNIIVTYLGIPITLEYVQGPVSGFAPNHWIFLIAIVLALLTYIPIFLLKKEIKKNPPVYEGLIEEKESEATSA